MAPTLHLVRHAQGYHSVAVDGHELQDPELTPRGKDQCVALCDKFPYHDQIDLLLASPMHRAIQTALIGFSPCVERGLRVVAIPEAQEGTSERSDVGSDKETVQQFSEHLDTRYVSEGWNLKEGKNATEVASISERAKRLRNWIRARPEKHIVLVSHGRFAHYMTGDINEKGEQTSGWWVEGEFRSYEFAADEPFDEEAMIIETEESKRTRDDK